MLDSPDLRLDRFIGPGHVSMVIGTAPYELIARHYRRPLVVAGLEPQDVLQSVHMLLAQIAAGRCGPLRDRGPVPGGWCRRTATPPPWRR